MKNRSGVLACLAVALTLAGSPGSAQTGAVEGKGTGFVVRGARVFDGVRNLGQMDVLVQGGKIAAAGKDLAVPPGTREVAGAGKTLLPGLIDSHTHTWGAALQQALLFGVTTELDMFTQPQMAAQVKQDEAAGKGLDGADLRTAGILATAPGGHGTEYGMEIPTLTRPAEAQAWVDARLAEGSDYIKIVIEDGKAIGITLPTLDQATVAALVAAAHARGKLAVVHVTTLAAAREAIAAGADGLAHLFVDVPPDAEFGRFVAAHHAFVIPTLSVLASIVGCPPAAAAAGAPAEDACGGLVRDPRLAPFVDPDVAANMTARFAHQVVASAAFANPAAAVRQLLAAGVPILAGTDAPNPGTAHGVSEHGELALLVAAGLTPIQALAAATSVPAATFHLADRGRIAPGMRADLLLVDGDPTTDIRQTRAIAAVWKQGVLDDRQGARAAAAAAAAVKAAFGAGWSVSTDQLIGGASTAALAVADGAPASAPPGSHALAVTGTVAPGGFVVWAGASYRPSGAAAAASDLSAKSGLRFWARGDGRTYQVMVFAKSRGRMPLLQTFTAGADWQEHKLPWSGFAGYDGHDVQLVVFAAGAPPGAFAFQLAALTVE